jgi:hypothetical protein
MELVQTFNKTLNDFINNLRRCYPIVTNDFNIIESIQDTKSLQLFMKSALPVLDEISRKDPNMFSSPFLMTLNECDLSVVWRETKSDGNREVIWKYLQTLVLIGNTIRSKSANLEQYFEKFVDNKDVKNAGGIQEQMMNIINELTRESAETSEFMSSDDNCDDNECDDNECDDNEDASPGIDTEKYAEMFKNTKIGHLAKEIAEDIDMSAFGDLGDLGDLGEMNSPDVSSLMQKLIGGGGLQKLVQSVTHKLKAKMASGDINQDELIGEIHDMMESMKHDKKFKKMFKSKDIKGIFKEFMTQKGLSTPGSTDDDDFGALEELFGKMSKENPPQNINPNLRKGGRDASTRNRLRKKLEKRQQNC